MRQHSHTCSAALVLAVACMLCATTGVHGEAYTVLWTPSATEQVAEQVASSAFGFVDTGTISVDVTCVCSRHDYDCVISVDFFSIV